MKISREVRYLIAGLVFGFLLCFGLYSMVVTASASELETPEASAAEVSEVTSIVQDEQTEAADTEPIAAETTAEAVQDAQSETETGQSIDQSEAEQSVIDRFAREYVDVITLAEESTGAESIEFYMFAACGMGIVAGAVFGLAFISKWQVGL